MRDASFRAETIFHEYNHGTSLRLTGGPNINCLNGDEQAGEGWSDFFAITFLMNPAIDDPNKPRGYGQWALYADSRIGPGFRAAPYSRDMALQPFTYDSIKSNGWLDGTSLALPHGLGTGWAAVLWDMAWDLVDKYGFNPNAYGKWDTGGNNRAIQYVMDGLKMQGCNPGLVVARAAIIAAQQALTGGADTCTVWSAFARRGLGYSAVQGGTGRNDNTEAFDTHPDCQRGFTNVTAEPALTTIAAGSPYPLQFKADGDYRGLDIAKKDNPYSRQVDCTTLKTVTPGHDADHAAAVPGHGGHAGGHVAVGRRRRHLHLPVADRRRLGQLVPRVRADHEDGRAAPRLLQVPGGDAHRRDRRRHGPGDALADARHAGDLRRRSPPASRVTTTRPRPRT